MGSEGRLYSLPVALGQRHAEHCPMGPSCQYFTIPGLFLPGPLAAGSMSNAFVPCSTVKAAP